jgi:hypothetical protein
VAEVFPELAVRDGDGRVETVHYETLNVLLVNEVQKQQQRIDALQQKLKISPGCLNEPRACKPRRHKEHEEIPV